MTITEAHIEKLIEIESLVNYRECPPRGVRPYKYVGRDSRILISAPHGARTYRGELHGNPPSKVHQEDEYTAGMALLLAELLETSVIATVWCTRASDPNHHQPETSSYKRQLRRLIERRGVRYVIDLHGAGPDGDEWLVDLGTRNGYSIDNAHRTKFAELIEYRLGERGAVRAKQKFAGDTVGRITRYVTHDLREAVPGVSAIQVEMKPDVRIALRRPDASVQKNIVVQADRIIGMMQAVADFVEYLRDADGAGVINP